MNSRELSIVILLNIDSPQSSLLAILEPHLLDLHNLAPMSLKHFLQFPSFVVLKILLLPFIFKHIKNIILYSISNNSNIYSLCRADSTVYYFNLLSLVVTYSLIFQPLLILGSCFLEWLSMAILLNSLQSSLLNSISIVSARHLKVLLSELLLTTCSPCGFSGLEQVECGLMVIDLWERNFSHFYPESGPRNSCTPAISPHRLGSYLIVHILKVSSYRVSICLM